jgi:hypothetical protein
MTKAGDTREDLIGRLGPHEGLRSLVIHGQVVVDGRLEVARAAVNATAELFLGEQREPALDEIDPGRALRREVQMIPGTLRQPALDQGGLVGGVVVPDEWTSRSSGIAASIVSRNFPELDRPMSAMPLADHAAALGVEGCEERRGPVTDIVVRAPLDLPGAHRQQRLTAVQSLDLRLLVHTQHQRLVRRVQIQSHDVPDLVDEQRIGRQLERLASMRLQAERAPDPADGALAQAILVCHGPRAVSWVDIRETWGPAAGR